MLQSVCGVVAGGEWMLELLSRELLPDDAIAWLGAYNGYGKDLSSF